MVSGVDDGDRAALLVRVGQKSHAAFERQVAGRIAADEASAAVPGRSRVLGWPQAKRARRNPGTAPRPNPCIIGLDRSAIGTLVERTTRFTMLLHLPRMDGYGTEPRIKARRWSAAAPKRSGTRSPRLSSPCRSSCAGP